MKDKIIIVLDTETLGIKNRQVYEIGYVVATADGKVLRERDYMIKQTYENISLFNTAYYANKRSIYEQKLADGLAKSVYWGYAMKVLANDIARYGVSELYAYNSAFDISAIELTHKRLGAKTRPTADGIIDIMDFIGSITDTNEYMEFCVANGYMTKANKPQTKAETLFRYITNNNDFIEDHMALEDSRIELDILMRALAC